MAKTLDQKIKSLFNIKNGRVNRLDLFILTLVTNPLYGFLEKAISKNLLLDIAVYVIIVAIIYFQISLVTKRIRDIGKSGWFAILYFTALVIAFALMEASLSILGVILLIVTAAFLIFWPGQKFDNKYGPYDPTGIFKPIPKIK